MRILHVIDSMRPESGGPPAIASRLAAAQAIAGHDVVLACRIAGEGRGNAGEVYTSIPGIAQVRQVVLGPSGTIDKYLGLAARRRIRALLIAEKIDVMHLHGVWDSVLRAAASEAQARGIPYCVLLNGMLDVWSLAQKPLKKRLALSLLYRGHLNRAAFLHVGNEDERRLIEPLRLTAPRVIIPNGVFSEELANLPLPGSFTRNHPGLAGRRYVLFLSRLHFKKGLDILAEAFARIAPRFPDVDLVVAGPDDGAAADFGRRIAAAGLAGRTHLVGALFGRDKYAAMVDAACVCLPGRQEGVGVAITEALGCGTPCVISTECHFPEVANENAGFVAALDAGAIADALCRILSDPSSAKAMGARGRDMVLSRYTWPAIAEQCIGAYRRAIAGEFERAALGG